MDDRAARCRDLAVQVLDIRAVIGSERDHFDAVRLRLVEPNHMVLVVAVGLEPGQAFCTRDLYQAPVVGIELALGIEVLDAVADIADLGHSAHRSASSSLISFWIMRRARVPPPSTPSEIGPASQKSTPSRLA